MVPYDVNLMAGRKPDTVWRNNPEGEFNQEDAYQKILSPCDIAPTSFDFQANLLIPLDIRNIIGYNI